MMTLLVCSLIQVRPALALPMKDVSEVVALPHGGFVVRQTTQDERRHNALVFFDKAGAKVGTEDINDDLRLTGFDERGRPALQEDGALWATFGVPSGLHIESRGRWTLAVGSSKAVVFERSDAAYVVPDAGDPDTFALDGESGRLAVLGTRRNGGVLRVYAADGRKTCDVSLRLKGGEPVRAGRPFSSARFVDQSTVVAILKTYAVGMDGPQDNAFDDFVCLVSTQTGLVQPLVGVPGVSSHLPWRRTNELDVLQDGRIVVANPAGIAIYKMDKTQAKQRKSG